MGGKNTHDDYDIVFDIPMLSTKEGWPLYVSDSVLTQLVNCETPEAAFAKIRLNQTNHSIIAVLGLFNRGKTFLLNRLANVNLPSDKKIHTKGLSFRVPTQDGINAILLDTAGTNAPMEFKTYGESSSGEAVIEAMAHKKTTEMFIQDLAFHLADFMVVVVNTLTWPDQEYLQSLQRKLIEIKPKSSLFVVHNYYDVSTEEDLLHLWKKYVLMTHHGVAHKQVITTPNAPDSHTIIFREEVGSRVGDNNPVMHFFLAREGSPAGNIWNERTTQCLRQMLFNRPVPTKPILKELLEKNILDVLKIYTLDPEPVKITYEAPGKETKVKIKPKESKTKFDMEDFMMLKPEELLPVVPPKPTFKIITSGDLSLKRSKVDFDGFRIYLQADQFIPKYDVLQQSEGLFVIVDLPGVANGSNEKDGWIKERTEIVGGDASYLILEGKRPLWYLQYNKNLTSSTPSRKKVYLEAGSLHRFSKSSGRSSQNSTERLAQPSPERPAQPSPESRPRRSTKSVSKNKETEQQPQSPGKEDDKVKKEPREKDKKGKRKKNQASGIPTVKQIDKIGNPLYNTRQGGPFTVKIKIPLHIEDNLSKAEIILLDGLYMLFLPNKVLQSNIQRKSNID